MNDTIPGQISIEEALRDDGIARVTAASSDEDVRAVDRAIAELNSTGTDWSTNDLRRRFDDLHVKRPQLIGARVRAAAMRKQMRRVGYVPSDLPSTHAHPIALWRGASKGTPSHGLT